MTTPNSEQPAAKRKRAKNKRAKDQPLSDNMFKEVTENLGQEFGMDNVAGELQLRRYTRSDLVLQVPDGRFAGKYDFRFLLSTKRN